MPTVSEPVDREQIDGRVQGLVEHYRAGRITEYVLWVSLNIVLRDPYEARAVVALVVEQRESQRWSYSKRRPATTSSAGT